jgi:hypothetical protein
MPSSGVAGRITAYADERVSSVRQLTRAHLPYEQASKNSNQQSSAYCLISAQNTYKIAASLCDLGGTPKPGSADMARDDAGTLSDDPGPIETGPVTKGTASEKFSVGDISNSVGIVIGSDSTVRVSNEPQASQLDEAISELQRFMDILAEHETNLADSNEIRETVTALQAELASARPRAAVVRSLLKSISAMVVGSTLLAEHINNIQAVLAHTF